MSFTSLWFFLFCALVLVLYYFIVPGKWQWVVLLGASYIFYILISPSTVIYIIITTISIYLTGILLERAKKSADPKAKRKKSRTILAVCLLLNLGILLVLKYYNFFADSLTGISDLIGIYFNMARFDFLIPLGLSFYTFQSMGYVIDVYRNRFPAQKNIFRLALFVSYFPQIIQGPISKFDELQHNLISERKFDWDRLRSGLSLVMWGLFKKMIIADRLVLPVTEVFDHYQKYRGMTIFAMVFLYSIQLYCDFSGGIDIAMGVSEIFGIRLTENFRQPFFATGINDYWRRWHISLGRWMKDYLFYPLSLSKAFTKIGRFTRKYFSSYTGKVIPACLATVIVFLAVGVWQGPGWQNIAYGLYNGVLISLALMFKPQIDGLAKIISGRRSDRKAIKAGNIVKTILLITIGRYFSRADSLQQSFRMLQLTFSQFTLQTGDFRQILTKTDLAASDIYIVALAVVLLFAVDFYREKGFSARQLLNEKMPAFVQVLIVFTGVLVLVVFGFIEQNYVPTEFIYRQI